MAAWGSGPFENDDAADYADGITQGRDLTGLERTLDKAIGAGKEYLEAPDGAEALAAGEIVARLLGRPAAETPRLDQLDKRMRLDDWVRNAKLVPAPQLINKARRAVERVKTEPSELMELWIDSDDFDSWQSAVEDLLGRLAG